MTKKEIKRLIALLQKVGRLYTVTDAACIAAFVILETKRNGRPIDE